MAQRDLRVSNRPTRPYTIPDFIREELRAQPISPRRFLVEVIAFFVVLFLIIVGLQHGLALGPPPS